jgi:hypothetical protein
MTKKLRRCDLFVFYATENFRDVVVHVLGDLYHLGVINFWLDQLSVRAGESIPLKKRLSAGVRDVRQLAVAICTQRELRLYGVLHAQRE